MLAEICLFKIQKYENMFSQASSRKFFYELYELL